MAMEEILVIMAVGIPLLFVVGTVFVDFFRKSRKKC
jgi:hypothetical protein